MRKTERAALEKRANEYRKHNPVMAHYEWENMATFAAREVDRERRLVMGECCYTCGLRLKRLWGRKP